MKLFWKKTVTPNSARKLFTAATALILYPTAHSAAQEVAAAGREGAAAIESVTVNARRREEDAQIVPIPIAAVDGGALESAGQFRLEDLNQKLPSTNVFFQNPRQSSVAVRGLGNNPANDALESSVGVYLDNVYLGRPGMANLDLIDIDQLALLRGPQGTLFGKNTTAGVLNISTRKPTFTPEGKFEVSAGNFDYYQLRGAVSGPLTEILAGRLSLSKTHRGGFLDNPTTGDKINTSDREGARGQLLFQPSDDFDIRFIAEYNNENDDCCAAVRYAPGANNDALLKSKIAAAGVKYYYDKDYLTTFGDVVNTMQVEQGGSSAEINWDTGAGQLTSITAWRFWKFEPHNDADGYGVSGIADAGQLVDDKQWSQEVRWASLTGGAFDYVVGAYYFYQKQNNVQYTQYGPDAGFWFGQAAFNNVYTATYADLKTDSGSAFAQGTWHITDPFSLTGGLRFTHEKKTTAIDREPPTAPNPAVAALAFPPLETGDLDRTDNNVSALLSAAYQLRPDFLLYGSVARGAKSGGINPSIPPSNAGIPAIDTLYVEPEVVVDYEAGFKSSWLDRRLQLNANLFWADVDDYQSTLMGVYSGRTVQLLANVGGVRTRGIETEIIAVPVDGLTLELVASFNDVKYSDYSDAPCTAEAAAAGQTTCDLTGENLYLAPRWIANPAVTYEFSAPFNLKAFAHVNYAWRSKYFGSLENSRDSEIGANGLFNARIGVRNEEDHWNVSLWGNNIFDNVYVTSANRDTANGGFTAIRGLPRTYGVTVGFDY